MLPDGPGPHPALIVAHASGMPLRDAVIYRHLAYTLPAQGAAVLVFDRRGSGASGGDIGAASFDDLAADLIAAMSYLKQRPDIDGARLGLWGLSQGGWLAPLAAVRSEDAAFVVAVSASGLAPAPQMDYSAAFALRSADFPETAVTEMLALRARINEVYQGKRPAAEVQQELQVVRHEAWYPLAYLDSELPDDPQNSKWALEMTYDPLPIMQALSRPLLLIYGETDAWVPVEESIARWQANGPPDLTVHQIGDANHYMTSIARAGIYAADGPIVPAYTAVLVDWIKQQVGQRPL